MGNEVGRECGGWVPSRGGNDVGLIVDSEMMTLLKLLGLFCVLNRIA